MFASLQRVAAWLPEQLAVCLQEQLAVCSQERLAVWLLEQVGFGLVQAWLRVWLFAEIRARRRLLPGCQAPWPVRLQAIALKSRPLGAAVGISARLVRSQALLGLMFLQHAAPAPLRLREFQSALLPQSQRTRLRY